MPNMRRKLTSIVISILLLVEIISSASAEVFSKVPQTQKVPLTSQATIVFECRAGDELDNARYTWRKDDEDLDIEADGRLEIFNGELHISFPQASDAGKYMCIIDSDQGTVATQYAELIYQYLSPKTSSAQPTVEGNPVIGAILPCGDFAYQPAYSVYFMWENTDTYERIKPLGSPTEFISQNTGNLYLSNPTAEYSGDWRCSAVSLWEVNGQPSVAYANTVPLIASDSSTQVSPIFMIQPAAVTEVELNGKTYLECFASGNPPPQIAWSKDDADMPVSAEFTSAGQLYIGRVTSDVAGSYTCTATNDLGSVSASGSIDVQYPPSWIDQIESLSSDLSSTVTLICAASGVPAPTYTLYKNLVDITEQNEDSRTRVERGEGYISFHITDLNEDHAGSYQCMASNKFGNIVSSAVLQVNSYPPVISPELPAVTYAPLGGPVTIECPHTAAPAANVSWYKNDLDKLTDDGYKYIFGEDHSLVINMVEKSDEAMYTCDLMNILGMDEGTTNLKAFQDTILTGSTKDFSPMAGTRAELACSATHDPSLVLTWVWYHDGEKIVDALADAYQIIGGSLAIPSVTSKESGTYRCCAETKVGSPCANTVMSVTAPPDPPTNVRVESSTSTSQYLTWTAPFNNNNEITSYTIRYKNSYNSYWTIAETEPAVVNTSSCTVINLHPYNDYIYQIFASNAIGIGEPSEDSTTFNTQKGAPSKAPMRITGGGGDIGELFVKWKPLSKQYYGSDNIEYVIAIQKIPEGEGVILILPPPEDNNATMDEADDIWQETTVPGGKTQNYTFKVDESEVYQPYNVKIRADNQLGKGPWSRTRQITSFEIRPDTAVTKITTDSAKAYSAVLKWPRLIASTGRVKGYKVKIVPKAPETQEERELETHKGVPRIKLDGLLPNTVYFAYIAAFNTAGQGPWSAPYTFNTEKKPPSVAPKKVEVSIEKTVLSAKWEPIIYKEGQGLDEAPLLGYKVQYWWSNRTSASSIDHITTANKISFSVANNSLFNVRVMGYSAGGDGVASEVFFVSTQATASPGYIYCCGANTITFNSVLVLITTLLWTLFAKLDF